MSFDYDLVVIGGGSGGMAAAKKAAGYGKRVALFDYVKPSPKGTKWGLGGTCVNVGCIPKKLFHYSGLLGQSFYDATKLGWKIPEHPEHDWSTLRQNVLMYIKSLNFAYKTGLRSANVKYINAAAALESKNSVTYTLKGEAKSLTAETILIATGGRPFLPSIPGINHAITSDDIFQLKTSPGKTLCVGGGYIALECAGFLKELGLDVSVAVRSILLRGFDRQCADKIGSTMHDLGVNFLYGVTPKELVKLDNGKIQVTLTRSGEADLVEEYDTVLYATGREADTKGLGLENAGVTVTDKGKFQTKDEQTNVDNIYAVGDVLDGKPELTPVAIQAGELLASRLYGNGSETMDYELIATAVFTPYEYGTCGISEEEAEQRYGKENIETYLFEFSTLEFSAVHRRKHSSRYEDEMDADMSTPCLSKLVCLKTENERVLGFHFIGPNAGEICQGYALAMHCGVTKKQFNKLVGIHPTDAESFTAMDITRASGESFVAAGGCGGGKCG